MTSTKLFTIGLITLCTGLLGCERQVSYTEDIQPMMFASCLQCHDKNSEGCGRRRRQQRVEYSVPRRRTQDGP